MTVTKIVAIPADGGALGFGRLINPLAYVARTGVRCAAVEPAVPQGALLAADLVIVQRQHDPELLRKLREVRARGIPVIYEIDDDLHAIPGDNPVRALYPPGSPQLEGVEAMLRAATGVTVSTRALAASYARFNENVEVLPLCIDFELRDWRTREPGPREGRIVAGWAGGATHVADLRLVQEAVRDALQAEPRLDFLVLSTPGIQQWIARDWRLPPERLLLPPYRDYRCYPAGLSGIDVGLAPLVDTPFNRAKSNAKLIEYGAWSIPSIASPVEPYTDTIRPGVNGVFAATRAEWAEQIVALARDAGRRAALGAAIRALVAEEFDLGRTWQRWPEAWARLAANAR